jgi:hypothetical protein
MDGVNVIMTPGSGTATVPGAGSGTFAAQPGVQYHVLANMDSGRLVYVLKPCDARCQ